MKQIGRRKHFSLKNINYLKFYLFTLTLHILPFVLMSFFSSSLISSPFILFPLLSLPPFPFLFLLSSPAVWWSNKWRRHCSFCCKGRSRKMLAPSLLCLQHVWGATGRSHLLLPRWQDLLRPTPCWEAKTPLLCLWWGAYLGLQPFGLEMAEWFIFLGDLDVVETGLRRNNFSIFFSCLIKSACLLIIMHGKQAWDKSNNCGHCALLNWVMFVYLKYINMKHSSRPFIFVWEAIFIWYKLIFLNS